MLVLELYYVDRILYKTAGSIIFAAFDNSSTSYHDHTSIACGSYCKNVIYAINRKMISV